MTQSELVNKAINGERITQEEAEYSMYSQEIPENCPGIYPRHKWREIVCDGDHDVLECRVCGKQKVSRCTFDEDYN